MVLLLPISILLFCLYGRKKGLDNYKTFAGSILIWTTILLILTNVLSLFHSINRVNICISWCLVIIVTLILYIRKYGWDFKYAGHFSILQIIRNKKFSKIEIAMLLLLTVLFLILGIGAICTVPYNYDSMTYHLARVAHWMDNGSVNHYITCVDRQVYSPVLAEYALLHIYELTGSDTFVNLLQYFSYVISGFYIYKTARILETKRSFSLFGAFVFYTIPLAIAQSITSQNDLVAVLWMVLFVYYLVQLTLSEELFKNNRPTSSLIGLAMTIGFGFLTKTSICLSMVMFMPWLLLARVCKKENPRQMAKAAAVGIAVIVLLISETLVRNVLSCGHLISETTSTDIMVATDNIKYIFVNLLKNYSLLVTQHLWTGLNGFVYRIAIWVGAVFFVEVNNIAISYHGFDFLQHMNMGEDMYSHDIAPASFASYLALFAGVVLMGTLIGALVRHLIEERKSNRIPGNGVMLTREQIGYSISAWLSLGIIMALLRWQPWGTRIMLPAVAGTIVMSAYSLELLCRRLKQAEWVLVPLLVLGIALSAVPVRYNMQPAMENIESGFVGRMEHYFTFNKRYNNYEELCQVAIEQGVTDIGVSISGDGYDYPLWLLFNKENPEASLRHVLIGEADASALEGTPPECILFIEKDAYQQGDTIEYAGSTYTCIFTCSDSNLPDSFFIK